MYKHRERYVFKLSHILWGVHASQREQTELGCLIWPLMKRPGMACIVQSSCGLWLEWNLSAQEPISSLRNCLDSEKWKSGISSGETQKRPGHRESLKHSTGVSAVLRRIISFLTDKTARQHGRHVDWDLRGSSRRMQHLDCVWAELWGRRSHLSSTQAFLFHHKTQAGDLTASSKAELILTLSSMLQWYTILLRVPFCKQELFAFPVLMLELPTRILLRKKQCSDGPYLCACVFPG